jgi:hypothetical protein
VLKDVGHKVADAFGAEKTPETFLVNSQYKILYHGRIDDDTEGTHIQKRDLFMAVQNFLSGKQVPVVETKAFGCSITRQ